VASFRSLSETDRQRIRQSFMLRAQTAASDEWRDIWSSNLELLEGHVEGRDRLAQLALSGDSAVSMTAQHSLGQYWESIGATDKAIQAYEGALARATDRQDEILCKLHLARALNSLERHDDAADLLVSISVADNQDLLPDMAQFLMTELGTALLATARRQQATDFFIALISAYPQRSELPELRDVLLVRSSRS